jgi:hypothetical protein
MNKREPNLQEEVDSLKEEVARLKQEIDDLTILECAAKRAHSILSFGIKKALKIEEWPNFYKMYGGNGLLAEGAARYLIEEVEKLREKTNDKPKRSGRNSVRKPSKSRRIRAKT